MHFIVHFNLQFYVYIVMSDYLCVFISMKSFYMVSMHMRLFLWCFFMVKIVKMGFLFSINVCIFISVVLFHNYKLLKINMDNNGVFIIFIPMVLFYG